jgi:ribosomal protein L40E
VSKSIGLIFIIIIGGILFFIFKGCTITKSKLAPAIEESNIFFAKLKTKNYRLIYSSLGLEWRKNQSLNDFISFMDKIENALGSYETGVQKNIVMRSSQKGQIIVVQHAAIFTKSKNCIVTITLNNQNNTFSILDINFNSRELNKKIVCPKCSSVVGMFAKFCQKCGTELNEALNNNSTTVETPKNKTQEND